MRPPRRLLQLSAFRLALALGIVAALAHLIVQERRLQVPLVGSLELLLYDLKFQLRGAEPRTPEALREKRVVIAAGDEKTIAAHGRFPWDRVLYARLVDRLVEAGAAAIAFDLAISDEVHGQQEGDLALAGALERAGDRVVVGYLHHLVGAKDAPTPPEKDRGLALVGRAPAGKIAFGAQVRPGGSLRTTAFVPGRGTLQDVLPDPPIEPIARVAKRLGYFNLVPDPDGVIRRVPLLAWAGGVPVPSLDLAAAATALEIPNAWITPLSFGRERPELDRILLGPDRVVPVQPDGSMLVDFPGPPGGFEQLSIADLIDGDFERAAIEDRVVLIGVTALGTFDQRVTPFAKAQLAPGLEIHAAAIENLLTGSVLTRTAWTTPLELSLMLLFAVGLGLALARLHPRIGLLAYLVVAALYFVLDQALFRSGIVIASALPQLQLLVTFVGVTSYRYLTETREKEQLRRAFRFYLDEPVLEEMLRAPEKLKLGGEKRELTVLFSDIRGFTTLSEKLPPEALVAMLNEYLTPMTQVIFRNGGTLDKYMGDAIMCFFGAPVAQDDHAARACKTALEMQSTLHRLQEKWRAEGKPPLEIGIGINTGPMVVGNMGSDVRFDYTVMGDEVNLASRLEGANKEYGTRILVSERTVAKLEGELVVRGLGGVRVKGKREPVRIFELLGLGRSETSDPFVERFERGLALRHPTRDFAAAAAAFGEALALRPDDVCAARYRAECEAFVEAPPAPGWDGVYELTTK